MCERERERERWEKEDGEGEGEETLKKESVGRLGRQIGMR